MMNNSDFTETNYRNILKIAKRNYRFINFFDNKENNIDSKFIILRHDIDISVHRAYRMAIIEHEEDVRSTYFLLLSSIYYNVFEKEIRNLILSILSLNHSIGLHFDSSIYLIKTEKDFMFWLNFEKNILGKYFDISIDTFSIHNSEPHIRQKFNKIKYDGILDCVLNLVEILRK